MSDEYTQTVVLRDCSHVHDATVLNASANHQDDQQASNAQLSDTVGQNDYQEFENTSWLT